jgi:hypothetical protein
MVDNIKIGFWYLGIVGTATDTSRSGAWYLSKGCLFFPYFLFCCPAGGIL